MSLTVEELDKIATVRVLVGDIEHSIFYPIVTNEEITKILVFEKWDVMKAARRVATTIAFILSCVTYRERSGDLECWNNASIEYRKVLLEFLKESGASQLPSHIIPYAAGISKSDFDKYVNDPDFKRSPLAQISPCLAWWTKVENYPSFHDGVFEF